MKWLRKLEGVFIWVIWGPLCLLSLLLFILFVGITLADPHRAAIWLGLGFVIPLSLIGFSILSTWLSAWVRLGTSPLFLAELSKKTGGRLFLPSLWFPMRMPRIEGQYQGYTWVLSLSRRGGILTPAKVGGKFLLWGWFFWLEVEGPIGKNLGISAQGAWDTTGRFLGLSGGNITPWAKVAPQLMQPSAISPAQSLFSIPAQNMTILSSHQDIIATGTLGEDITPAHIAQLLEGLVGFVRQLNA